LTKKNTIYIVRNTEVLPSDGDGARLWRSGLVAEHLFKNNHRIKWVISSFDHHNKVNRKKINKLSGENDIYQVIKMLKTPGYKNNISIKRFVDHSIFAIKLFYYLCRCNDAKVIFVSHPTPESSFICTLYANLFGVKVAVDIRDLWPDVFYDNDRGFKKKLKKVILLPYILMTKYTLKNATSIVSVNKSFLEWCYRKGRARDSKDVVSFIPFVAPLILDSDISKAIKICSELNIDPSKEIIISFGGTIGEMFDFKLLLKLLEEHASNIKINRIKFIFCGGGSQLDTLRQSFIEFDNVNFIGHINSNVLYSLYSISTVVFAPYKKIQNFDGHLPNKFMEYLSSGKPIISSLHGDAASILSENNAGFSYSTSEELFDILESISDNPEDLKLKGNNARSVYETRFSPEKICVAIEKHLITLTNDKV